MARVYATQISTITFVVLGGDGLHAPVKAGRKTSWKELGYRADLVV